MDRTERDLAKLKDDNWEIRKRALTRLIKSDDKKAKEGLLQLLRSDDKDLVEMGVDAAGRMKNREAVPELLRILEDPDLSVIDYKVSCVLVSIPDVRAVPALIRQLKGHYRKDYVIEALGKIGVDDSQRMQIEDMMLNGSTKDEKRNAAEALAEIAKRKSVPAFIRALDDPDTRSAAIDALGEMEVKEARPALEKLMEPDDGWIARKSAIAVAKIGMDAADFEKLADLVRAGNVKGTDALSQIKTERSARVLVEAFTDKRINTKAMRAAKNIGKVAVPVLIEALKNKDYRVRHRAAEALGLIRDKRATRPLIQEMKKGTIVTKRKSIVALGRIKDPTAVPALVSMLKSGNGEQRALAAQALGRIKSTKAVRQLIKALDDADSDVVRMALFALGQIRDKRAIPTLLRILHQGNYRDSVIKALAKIGLKKLELESRISCMLALGRLDSLNRLGIRAIPHLKVFLGSQDAQVRMRVVGFLNMLAEKDGVPPSVFPMLKSAFHDNDGEVGASAATGLGSLVGKENGVLGFLEKQLCGEGLRYQGLAADALSCASKKGADISSSHGLLFQALGNGSQQVRKSAADALSHEAANKECGRKIIMEFRQIILGDDPNAKEALANALTSQQFIQVDISPLIGPLLDALCVSSQEEREIAIIGASGILKNKQKGKEVLGRLLGMLSGNDLQAQEAAAKTIDKGGVGTDTVVSLDPLFYALDKGLEQTRESVANILVRLLVFKKNGGIIPRLRGLLSEDDQKRQEAGALVLAKASRTSVDISGAMDPLFNLLVHGSERAKESAAEALVHGFNDKQKGKEVLPRLLLLLSEDDPKGQEAGLKVLAKSCSIQFGFAQELAKYLREPENTGLPVDAEDDGALVELQVSGHLAAPLVKALVRELPSHNIISNIHEFIACIHSVEELDGLRGQIIADVKGEERFGKPEPRQEAAEIVKKISARKNELLAIDVNVDRKKMKPPSGKPQGGHYRFGRRRLKT
jgi:HEAT repeat protein